MSWSFYARGTKSELQEKFQTFSSDYDNETREPAMAAVKAAIDLLPDDGLGGDVQAYGSGYHHSFGDQVPCQTLSVTFSVYPLQVQEKEPEKDFTGDVAHDPEYAVKQVEG